MAKPIFVVGRPRTGTTWLGNLIGQHSNVACVHRNNETGKYGIAESAYFSHIADKFGDLAIANNLIRLIEVFCNSDFFELTGLDKDMVYVARPQNYKGLFRLVMDRYAERKGTDFWLEKTPMHALYIDKISKYYPDAKFVVIQRNIVDQVRSAVKLTENKVRKRHTNGVKRLSLLTEKVFMYHLVYKHIKRFEKRCPDKMIFVRYEDLLSSRRETISAVCEFLGLDFQENMLETNFKAGTSFKSEAERKETLSAGQVRIVKCLDRIFGILPYGLYRIFHLLKQRIDKNKLPFWFFANKINRYNWVKRDNKS